MIMRGKAYSAIITGDGSSLQAKELIILIGSAAGAQSGKRPDFITGCYAFNRPVVFIGWS